MVIYEVNLEVPSSEKERFLNWLHTHIEQMLHFEGFERAKLYHLPHEDHPEQTTNSFHCVVHYHLKNRQSLQEYFNLHASQMRQEGLSLFGQKLKAQRRILIQQQ